MKSILFYFNTLFLHLLLLTIYFYNNENAFYKYYDGLNAIEIAKGLSLFNFNLFNFAVNPLQGLSTDLKANLSLLPELIIFNLIDNKYNRLYSYMIFYTILYLTLIYINRFCNGNRLSFLISAGLSLILLVLPNTRLMYAALSDVPIFSILICSPFLINYVMRNILNIQHQVLNIIFLFIIFILFWYNLLSHGLMAAIFIPMTICITISMIVHKKNFKLFIILFTLIASLSTYIYTFIQLIINSAFFLFPQELPIRSEIRLEEVSIILRHEKIPIFIFIIALLSSFKKFNESNLTFHLMIIFLLIDGLCYYFFSRPGPPTIYFEFPFLLLMISISAVEISNIVNFKNDDL